jgi:hypothetical protein
MQFLRRVDGAYQEQPLENDGRLVVWDMPENRVAVHMAMNAVSRDSQIELIDGRSATRRQRDMITHEAIMLTDDSR